MISRAMKFSSGRGGLLLIALCLFVPSFWMLNSIPPLWKDCDAYGQVTEPPGAGTILLFGPAYCFPARVPLYAGYAYDCMRAGSGLPPLSFFAQPILSDSGVFLLVLFQHLALCASVCLLIASVTRSFIVRLLLAALWTLNPIFYPWAHCVGTETLSLILLLLLAIAGLKIVKEQKPVPRCRWLVFALLFVLSMLTRHINGVLGALLPLAFIGAAVAKFLSGFRQSTPRHARWLRHLGWRALRNAGIATGVGLICILLSNGTQRLLSQAVGIRYYTTVGFTFSFRLGFLAPLSMIERDEVIQSASAATHSDEVRTLLEVFRRAPEEVPKLDLMALLNEAQALLPPTTEENHFDLLLNKMAKAVLLSHSRPFLKAVWADFTRSQKSTIRRVAIEPFGHTVFFFTNRESMAACANLVTFRGQSESSILDHRKHKFLRQWGNISYLSILLTWTALFALAIVLLRRRPSDLPFAAALIAIGLLMMLANCLLNEYQARYTLPMWELTLISITILLGTAARPGTFVGQKSKARRAARAPG